METCYFNVFLCRPESIPRVFIAVCGLKRACVVSAAAVFCFLFSFFSSWLQGHKLIPAHARTNSAQLVWFRTCLGPGQRSAGQAESGGGAPDVAEGAGAPPITQRKREREKKNKAPSKAVCSCHSRAGGQAKQPVLKRKQVGTGRLRNRSGPSRGLTCGRTGEQLLPSSIGNYSLSLRSRCY